MDSNLNFNTSLDMQAEALEQIRHKIWSPVPHKLRKVEDSHSTKSLIVKRSDSCTSTSSQLKRTPLQNFNANNSAFRSLFSKNNKFGSLQLASSNSSAFPSENGSPLAAEFTPSDNSGMEIEVPPTLFRRTASERTQNRLPETPKFRVSIHNPLREVQSNNTNKALSISDFLAKSQIPFGESFLPKEYLQLFSSLSANNSACASPTLPIKEDSKHKCDRHILSHGNNENANANTNNGNGESKIANFMKPDQNKKKTRHCNCKNSKCLKLYCECLAYGEYCDDQCNCCDCHNTTQKEEVRNYALSLIAEKKPAILEGGKTKQQKSSKIVRGKGCNCKKSACQKKYCECYNAAGGCGPHCKCEGCKNPYGVETENGDSDSSPISMDIVQELGLSFKKVALSDKSTGGNVKKNRIIQGNLSLFGREANETSNAKAPLTLPSLL